MLNNDPILLVFFLVIYLFFILISIRYPIIPAAIYPFTFISDTQTMFAVGGISPSKYIGIVLIFVGMLTFFNNIHLKKYTKYLHPSFLIVLTLFPAWILLRFVIEGSSLDWALTFLLNALTVFSIIVIINTEKQKKIIELSLGITFLTLSLGIILAYYFPTIGFLKVIQEADIIRAAGFYNDPNYGGAFIAIGFAYFFSKCILYYETKRMKLFYLSVILVALSIFSLILTFSRAAILSLVVCLLMMVLFGRIKGKNTKWLLGLSVGFSVIYLSVPAIGNTLTTRFLLMDTDPSNIARLRIFQDGFIVIGKNILWGTGIPYGYHNTYIDVMALGGIIGLIFFSLLIAWVLKMNMKILAYPDYDFRDRARFVIFGLIAFMFNSVFVGLERERIIWFLLGWGMINYIFYSNMINSKKLNANQMAPV